MKSITRGFVMGSCAALALSYAVSSASAVVYTNVATDNLNHAANATSGNTSGFFTASPDGLTTYGPDNGWTPTAPAQVGAQAATASSITSAKAFSLVGTATAANSWNDGNKVPAGLTLTFNAQFTFTAIGQQYLTIPANSGGGLGSGLGITFQNGPTGLDDIDPGEGISVSAVTVSSVVYSGTLSDPSYVYTPGSGSVSNFGTRVFRSNNFTEASTGAVLTTQGGGTIGFGTSTGTIASNLPIDNGYVNGAFGDAPINARQTAPYTFVVSAGASPVLKGIGFAYDVSYDIQAVPEPSTALLVVGGMATAAIGRRRRI